MELINGLNEITPSYMGWFFLALSISFFVFPILVIRLLFIYSNEKEINIKKDLGVCIKNALMGTLIYFFLILVIGYWVSFIIFIPTMIIFSAIVKNGTEFFYTSIHLGIYFIWCVISIPIVFQLLPKSRDEQQ